MVIFHRFLYVYQRVTGPNWAVGSFHWARWSLRDIGRVMQGLTLALENPNFATADLHRLWIHEVSRVFEDQLQMSIHKQLFQVGWWGWMLMDADGCWWWGLMLGCWNVGSLGFRLGWWGWMLMDVDGSWWILDGFVESTWTTDPNFSTHFSIWTVSKKMMLVDLDVDPKLWTDQLVVWCWILVRKNKVAAVAAVLILGSQNRISEVADSRRLMGSCCFEYP